jgi:hypothetical protein
MRQELLRCAKDPVYFMKTYVKIVHPTRGRLPFNTYTFQDDCVNAFLEHRFNIILKSRQLGLSTVTAAFSVWFALFNRDKSVLVIATKLDVAMNFIKKVMVVLNNLPPWFSSVFKISGETKKSVTLSNGSSITAVPTSEDAGVAAGHQPRERLQPDHTPVGRAPRARRGVVQERDEGILAA